MTINDEQKCTTTESPNSIRNIRKRQLVELLNVDPSLTIKDLAEKLNISVSAVYSYLHILSSENALGECQLLSKKRRERKPAKLIKPSKAKNILGERELLSQTLRKQKCAELTKLLNADPSLTIKDLATRLNISSSSVSNYLRTLSTENALGKCKYSNNKLIDLKCRKLAELLNEEPTLTIKELSQKLNVSTASVSNYLRRLSDKNVLCKRQRSSVKHIEPKCRDLAELINKDPTLTNDDLARILNVSTKTISKYLNILSDKNLLCERQSSNTKKCERKRVKLVELLNADSTLTNKELAEKLDISTSALSEYLRTLSAENVLIERHTLGKKRSEDKLVNKERVAELRKQDPTLTYKAISQLIGVSIVTVRNYILELERDSLQAE